MGRDPLGMSSPSIEFFLRRLSSMLVLLNSLLNLLFPKKPRYSRPKIIKKKRKREGRQAERRVEKQEKESTDFLMNKQNFIQKCLTFEKEKRPDVRMICEDAYLKPKTSKTPSSSHSSSSSSSSSSHSLFSSSLSHNFFSGNQQTINSN